MEKSGQKGKAANPLAAVMQEYRRELLEVGFRGEFPPRHHMSPSAQTTVVINSTSF